MNLLFKLLSLIFIFPIVITIQSFNLLQIESSLIVLIIAFGLLSIPYYMWYSRDVLIVNFENNRYKDCWKGFGIYLGFWTNLPKLSYIEVVKGTVEEGGVYMGTPYATFSSSKIVYKVGLIKPDNKRIGLHNFEKKEAAVEFAKKLSAGFKLGYKVVELF